MLPKSTTGTASRPADSTDGYSFTPGHACVSGTPAADPNSKRPDAAAGVEADDDDGIVVGFQELGTSYRIEIKVEATTNCSYSIRTRRIT
jgi:hypothetical protein